MTDHSVSACTVSHESDLDRARAQLASIVEHSEDAIIALDLEGRVTAWNRGAEALYGYAAGEVMGRRPYMIIPRERHQELSSYLGVVAEGRRVLRYETVRMRKDCSHVEVAITISPIRDSRGTIVGASTIARDITDSRRAERRRMEALERERHARLAAERSRRHLAEAQERFRVAFEQAPIGIALISAAPATMGSLLDVNPSLCEKLGRNAEALLGRPFLDFVVPEDHRAHAAPLDDLLAGRASKAHTETRWRRGDDEEVALEMRASVVRDREQRPLYMVAHFADVTEARRYERELRFLADHDPLTGLLNRRRFEEDLDRVLERTRDSGRPAAVLVVDLDNFKAVNDTYGHAAGDALLRRVAEALRASVRASDLVGRLGGDEFGVVLADVSVADARAIAGQILRAVEAEGAAPGPAGAIRVTASVGVSRVEPGCPLSAEAMLVEADVAMYEAKESGRNRLSVAHDESGTRSRRQWSRRVHDAIAGDGLELWEQPMLHLSTGRSDRSELLVRLRGRGGEAIPARDFMPVVTRFGQGPSLDRWVVNRGIELVEARQAAGRRDEIEINLSPGSLDNERVMGFIRERVRSANVDPSTICFGIAQTAAIGDLGAARRLMTALYDLGCRFALDDFGAGPGSLRQLKHLPFDVIKIDGEFVARLGSSRFDQLTVQAVVRVAQGSDRTTVAERVADHRAVELLRAFGVDYAQGYHVARPQRARAHEPARLAA